MVPALIELGRQRARCLLLLGPATCFQNVWERVNPEDREVRARYARFNVEQSQRGESSYLSLGRVEKQKQLPTVPRGCSAVLFSSSSTGVCGRVRFAGLVTSPTPWTLSGRERRTPNLAPCGPYESGLVDRRSGATQFVLSSGESGSIFRWWCIPVGMLNTEPGGS